MDALCRARTSYEDPVWHHLYQRCPAVPTTSYGTSGSVTCAQRYGSDPIYSCKEYVSLSTISLSLRVRIKYRSVILVGKRKGKRIESSQRWWGQPKFVFTPPQVLGMATDASREAKNKTPAVASSSFTRDAPRTLPKEEEETLRRCSGKMLFISIMREKQSTVLCVYFFW